MADQRRKNQAWNVCEPNGTPLDLYTYGAAQLAVLQDIRDELQKLNAILNRPDFQAVPRKLDRISRNTAKPRKPKGGQ